jgi:hypothetical protein
MPGPVKRFPTAVLAAFAFGASACTALSDPGIEFVCFRPPMTQNDPYEELFDEPYPALVDKCWEAKGTDANDVQIGDSDLSIGHSQAASFEKPPRFIQRFDGDFMIVAKVEATSGSNADFCNMGSDDAAGIVVRGGLVDAAFLLRPFLEEDVTPKRTCEDDKPNPPKAVAEAFRTGRPFDPTLDRSPGIGEDGEGDIAVCRRQGRLSYYYRNAEDPAVWNMSEWERLATTNDDVGEGPVEVGLATTLGQAGVDLGLSVEGHFNWVVLSELSNDCSLDDLERPEPD